MRPCQHTMCESARLTYPLENSILTTKYANVRGKRHEMLTLLVGNMVKKTKNVVDRAIEIGGEGNASEFARRLSKYCGFEVSRQAVNNWRRRGAFSRNVVIGVHSMTNLPMTDLVDAPWLQGASPVPTPDHYLRGKRATR